MQTETKVSGVVAGTLESKLALILSDRAYEIIVPRRFFSTMYATLDLTNYGHSTFVDIEDPKHVNRKEKIINSPGTLHNVLLLIKTPNSTKYAAVITCANCRTPVRCFTSDLHQTHMCAICTVKMNNFIAEMQRALAHNIKSTKRI